MSNFARGLRSQLTAVMWSQRENGLQECAVIAHDRTAILAEP